VKPRAGASRPAGLVDIHCHLLPGIDDGPGDLDGSLALARAAAAAGVSIVAATPHLRADFPDVHVRELAERCKLIQAEVDREGIELEVVAGAEASLAWALEASEEELALASYAQRGRDLLIETPPTGLTAVETLVYSLRLKGLRITLAHPERSVEEQDRAALTRLVEQGVVLQVNADALLGKRRSPAGRMAAWLCTEGLAQVVASDGHRASSWRPVTAVGEAASALARLVGEARAQWMTAAVPAAIISSEPLPEAPAIRERRGLWPWR
jgi:protein-tyrosine phosphatase